MRCIQREQHGEAKLLPCVTQDTDATQEVGLCTNKDFITSVSRVYHLCSLSPRWTPNLDKTHNTICQLRLLASYWLYLDYRRSTTRNGIPLQQLKWCYYCRYRHTHTVQTSMRVQSGEQNEYSTAISKNPAISDDLPLRGGTLIKNSLLKCLHRAWLYSKH